jgi:flagellar protein FlaG
MKIDSMDAKNVYNESAKHVEQSKKNETKTDPITIKHVSESEQKHISDITGSEKNAMSVGEKVLIEAIEKANKVALGRNTSFRFSVHEATKRISVKVLDKETNEVIREIPPEKVLDMVARMWEMAGIIVDEKR